MKFTDGYWLTKKGYNVQSPQEVRSYKVEKDKITAYAPYNKISGRGDTLNIGLTTLALSSPMKDIICIKLTHHDIEEKGPYLELLKESPTIEIYENKTDVSLKTGNLTAKLQLNDRFKLTFLGENKVLTESLYKAQGCISDENNNTYMREQLTLAVDEYIYGLGERFTPFIKNGQSVDIWNRDGGTGSEQAYKNIPFYISNKGYGVFVNHPEEVSYEIASENVSRAQFSVQGESLEYYIIYGPSTKEILKKYTDLTGKPALPPAWSFGLWLSTSFTTKYDEATITEFIDGMADRNIPLDVFHFDCFWMKEFEWCNFEWDKDAFKDPEGMLKRLHEKGLKICVWINPYIAQKSPLFKEGKENGYFLKRENGDVWQWDLWQAGQGIVDFTNPDARKWYTSKLSKLLDMGVDCFKTDFGERIPTDAVYYDGSDPYKAHNYYAYLYNKTVFELLKEKRGEKEAVVFARSAFVGSQKFPVHWGGDNLSAYSSMAESLRGGLSFLLSGFGFWSHDIGGFEEETSPDIYKRWTQFGLLSTHSRYHGNIQYRVPWNFDEEAVEVTRKFVNLKLNLMPYLYKEAIHTSKTGIPMMRPVFMEFEDDLNTFVLDKEYMLGESLLVAPIFSSKGDVTYYLPKGKWHNLLTDSYYDMPESGKWLTENYDYMALPLLVRENTILVMGDNKGSASYAYEENVTIHIFQISGEKACKILNIDGAVVANITVLNENNERIIVKQRGLVGDIKAVLYENGSRSIHNFNNEELIIDKKAENCN
jgi:alpha-D-xyloside xylohydrolase